MNPDLTPPAIEQLLEILREIRDELRKRNDMLAPPPRKREEAVLGTASYPTRKERSWAEADEALNASPVAAESENYSRRAAPKKAGRS